MAQLRFSNNVVNRVVDGRHLFHCGAIHHFELQLAVDRPALLHILVGTNGPHHEEVRPGQVFVEREAVAPGSLLVPPAGGGGG